MEHLQNPISISKKCVSIFGILGSLQMGLRSCQQDIFRTIGVWNNGALEQSYGTLSLEHLLFILSYPMTVTITFGLSKIELVK